MLLACGFLICHAGLSQGAPPENAHSSSRCSSNYLDALMAVFNESVVRDIPYKVILLDSWWYYKGIGDGVKNWTAMPSVFPGGNAGMRELAAATGWKIIAHNRYWRVAHNP